MNRSLSVLVVALVAAGGAAMQAAAQAPQIINYQGRLLQGTNLVNGNVGLSLRLFNVASGGTQLYEDSNTVAVVDGLYSTFIGDNPTNVALLVALTNAEVWVEVAVDGSTLTPRERLASVAHALSVWGIGISPGVSNLPNVTVLPVQNAVDASAFSATISGGRSNLIGRASHYSVIAGGNRNSMGTNVVNSTMSGGWQNTMEANTASSIIGGGFSNRIATVNSYATIGGGTENRIGFNSFNSVIGGGSRNQLVGNNSGSAIAGGSANTIGNISDLSFIGGGGGNSVAANNDYSTIAGGGQNDIGAAAYYSTIGGGYNNSVGGDSFYATIAGGGDNDIGSNSYASAIGGGSDNNVAADSLFSTIAGGGYNDIATNSSYATISGGRGNNISNNSSYAVIAGGRDNSIGENATNAFAAGRQAKANHRGTFVWADNTSADFASTAPNQFLVRAAGGVGINTNQPGAALHVAGEAMIGSTATPARFGMAAVRLTSIGNLFVHPADTNLILTWDSGARVLSITNTSSLFYDCQMQVVREETYNPVVNSRDIATQVGVINSLRLTNSIGENAGWSATAVRENNVGAGFQFNGSGYNSILSGLVIYWY